MKNGSLRLRETTSRVELFLSPKTLREKLVEVVRQDTDNEDMMSLFPEKTADFVIHIFPGDEPEEYIYMRGEEVVAVMEKLVNPSNYIRCRISRTGKVRVA